MHLGKVAGGGVFVRIVSEGERERVNKRLYE